MGIEELVLLRENNRMLKKICDYIDKVESKEYQLEQQFNNMLINVVANATTNRK